ncbi:hypothetical protein SUGI_0135690 [Cryptomeria japonica]|nr:hypothetical protein SUGI_0135690 [Cryptomeria japonica]
MHNQPSLSSPAHIVIDDKFCSIKSTTFTVWKKSLIFNGKGFTVFDSAGNLAFRVDNYASNAKSEILLMDDVGNVLITLLRKRWNLHRRWDGFRGDTVQREKPIFTVTKSSFFSNKIRANVFLDFARQIKRCDYQMEGWSCKSSCTIFSASRDIIAQFKQKEAKSDLMLGNDVFTLLVQPQVDQAFIMGLIVIFYQIR